MEEQKNIIEYTPTQEYPKINWPSDIYNARIEEIQDTQGEYGECKRLIILVENKINNESAKLAYTMSARATSNNRTTEVLETLGINKDMLESGKVTWDDVLQKKCRVLLEYKIINGDNKCVITKILPTE
jgi:hypothetical protein